jgi:hypothetical protein
MVLPLTLSLRRSGRIPGDQQVGRRDVQRAAILFGYPRLSGSSETGCRPRIAPDQQL